MSHKNLRGRARKLVYDPGTLVGVSGTRVVVNLEKSQPGEPLVYRSGLAHQGTRRRGLVVLLVTLDHLFIDGDLGNQVLLRSGRSIRGSRRIGTRGFARGSLSSRLPSAAALLRDGRSLLR